MKLNVLKRSVAAAALMIAGCTHASPVLHGTVIDRPAPPLVLQRGDQARFSLQNERGNVVLLFFGYTHCPDVCPTTLTHIAMAKKLLPTAIARHVVAVFVSVDPQRDVPAVADRYARLFDPTSIGLSGSPAAVKTVEAAYHVWSQPLAEKPHTGEYLVAHSSDVFLIDARGQLRELLDWNDDPAAFAKEIKAVW